MLFTSEPLKFELDSPKVKKDPFPLLRRLRLPRAERKRIERLVLNHLRPGHLADAGNPARGVRRLVRDAGRDLPLLVLHAGCDVRA